MGPVFSWAVKRISIRSGVEFPCMNRTCDAVQYGFGIPGHSPHPDTEGVDRDPFENSTVYPRATPVRSAERGVASDVASPGKEDESEGGGHPPGRAAVG